MPEKNHDHSDEIEYISIKKEEEKKEEQKGLALQVKKEEPNKEEKPESDEVKALKAKLRKRDSEIKHLKKELDEFKDKYLRKLADMENLKKRVEREKIEFQQFALSDLLLELLLVLDNFERAMETKDAVNGKSFREGVEMIYRQYLDLLMKKGVKPLEFKGKKFDPNLQQALITEESEEVEEPEVSEEFQKGYLLHNRLLRPAIVKVKIPKKKEEKT
jgi:molecular chaperone GrpE